MKINKISKNLEEVIKGSVELAKRYRSPIVDENLLFVALLQQKESAAVRTLQDLEIDIDSTTEKVLSNFYSQNNVINADLDIELTVSDEYKKIIENAYKIAMSMFAPYVGTEHLLISWYEIIDNELKDSLIKKGIDYNSLFSAVRNTIKYPILVDEKTGLEKNSILKLVGKNLTEMARKGQLDPVIGREKEMNRLASIILRRTKNNPILIGDAGVGKTAIVEGLAERIISGEVPYAFTNKTIWQIDSTLLMAGSAIRGDIENKLLALIEEVSADKNIVLFIDELHTIMGANSQGGPDIANILKPALSKGQLRCIGATTYAEYVKYVESDPALARRFQPIFVEEIDAESAKEIVMNIKPIFEKYHNVKISEEVVDESIQLSERYITERYLPDKILDLLDEASAKINMNRGDLLDANSRVLSDLESEQERLVLQNDIEAAAKIRQAKRDIERLVSEVSSTEKPKLALKPKDIREVISQWTNIPVESMSTIDIKKIRNLSKILKERIIGQDRAVDLAANMLQVAKVGITDEKKPLASFLFAGPTGVGKTELAKQIAGVLFGNKDSFIQLDMSEFMEAHSVSKLIGSPPGYIGFDMGGMLTEKIRKRPYSVILFDEIEKAHPDILNIMLQILEEGRLTDSKGKIANFKNTVVIMTTNLGAQAISDNNVLGIRIDKKLDRDDKSKEKAYEELEKIVINEIKKSMLPEFMNRIGRIVVFRALQKTDISKIAMLELLELGNRLKNYKKLNVEFSNKLAMEMAEKGFDEEYGARNIKRKINEIVELAIGEYLLNTRSVKSPLYVDYKKDAVRISSK